MSHSKKTVQGIKWSVIDQIVRQFVTLIISAFLSRLLSPTEFGLIGMVTVAIGFLNVFKEFGLGSSIIHQSNLSKISIDSVFWLNTSMGLCISVLVAVAAPYIADFYHQPILAPLTLALAANFFISSFNIVPDALIRKAIDFKSYFFRNLGSVLLSGVIAIVLALKGWGVWALVAQSIFSTVTSVLIGFRMIKWRPSFQFSAKHIKGHLRFSLPLLGESSINYWVRNIDNLLVGKLLGPIALGYYSKAYNLMLLPVRQISGTLTSVMFPSFSIIKNDINRVWKQYKSIISIIAAVTFPLMAGLALFAETVISIVYGKQWLAIVPFFRVLCFLGAMQSIGTLCGSIFSSQGKTLLAFKIGLVLKPLMIAGIVIGLFWKGLMGMIWGYTMTSTIAFMVESFFVVKILNKNLAAFFLSMWREASATMVGVVCVLSVKHLVMQASQLNWVETLVLIIIFILVYIICCLFLQVFAVSYFKSKWYGRKTIPAYNAG